MFVLSSFREVDLALSHDINLLNRFHDPEKCAQVLRLLVSTSGFDAPCTDFKTLMQLPEESRAMPKETLIAF